MEAVSKIGQKVDRFKARHGEYIILNENEDSFIEGQKLIALVFHDYDDGNIGQFHNFIRASLDGKYKSDSPRSSYCLLRENQYECTGELYSLESPIQEEDIRKPILKKPIQNWTPEEVKLMIACPEFYGTKTKYKAFHGEIVKVVSGGVSNFQEGEYGIATTYFHDSSTTCNRYIRISKYDFVNDVFKEYTGLAYESDYKLISEIKESKIEETQIEEKKEQSVVPNNKPKDANYFLEEAKKRYPIGTFYISAGEEDDVHTCKVKNGDFKIWSLGNDEFCIHGDPDQRILYDSRNDEWAKIINKHTYNEIKSYPLTPSECFKESSSEPELILPKTRQFIDSEINIIESIKPELLTFVFFLLFNN